MAKLHQIMVRFNPEQDRLLLCASTEDQQEWRLWLTRRLVKLLWPALLKALGRNPLVAAQADTGAKATVMDFQRQKALQQADFKTPYQEGAKAFPLGEDPILVTKLQIRSSKAGGWVLRLSPGEGPGLEMAADETLLHALCAMLAKAIEKSDWSLDLGAGPAPVAPQPVNLVPN